MPLWKCKTIVFEYHPGSYLYIFRIFRIIRYNDLTLLLFLLFKMLPCLTKIPAIVCNTSVFSHPLDVHKLIIAHNK